ncbi:DUF4118 domain-containing protein [Acidicapsa acidisoli]|uniref:DUF4118 domain-containing protein n=1 Tax=Acidicapsa acidisoli TaxID=1615681 RepID=UPI0021DFA447|nr:DUF4118 domain-containing protein [Acidicapsa acidisoli]
MNNQILKRWIQPIQRLSKWWCFPAAIAGLGLLTYCGILFHASLPTMSLLFLFLVISSALLCGFWLASVTSCAAAACLDFFFTSPLYSFRVSSAHGYVALVSFEVTALVISNLLARALRHAREATEERASMEQLYELSKRSLQLDLNKALGPELAILIHRIFGVRGAALFDASAGSISTAGDWNRGEEKVAMKCYLRGTEFDNLPTQRMRRVLRIGNRSVGSLVVHGELSSVVLNAPASLAVTATERYQVTQKENRAESAKQSEQLRAAVLDALAHDFKTPLTAIQAASSGLIEMGGLASPQSDMVSLIDKEATFLNELCTRLLQTAKLDAEHFDTGREEVNVHELISDVLSGSDSDSKRNPIEITMDAQSANVYANRGLLTIALSQFIENACKYSTAGTPVEIAVRKSTSDLLISAHNFGSLVHLDDRELIFERFYRSSEAKETVAGTGIGLSAVKMAADANRAHLWVWGAEYGNEPEYLRTFIRQLRKKSKTIRGIQIIFSRKPRSAIDDGRAICSWIRHCLLGGVNSMHDLSHFDALAK